MDPTQPPKSVIELAANGIMPIYITKMYNAMTGTQIDSHVYEGSAFKKLTD
jgi:hypothetical protein